MKNRLALVCMSFFISSVVQADSIFPTPNRCQNTEFVSESFECHLQDGGHLVGSYDSGNCFLNMNITHLELDGKRVRLLPDAEVSDELGTGRLLRTDGSRTFRAFTQGNNGRIRTFSVHWQRKNGAHCSPAVNCQKFEPIWFSLKIRERQKTLSSRKILECEGGLFERY